ncbi:unnamed protein product [Orchesella dallaii]|uniref:Uncharacterized protein n=1 Tax=Orchesella dallaii TaxID=48710 RepID=A0ABP1RNZ2_9HEXA
MGRQRQKNGQRPRSNGGGKPISKTSNNLSGTSSSAFPISSTGIKPVSPLGFCAVAEKLFPILMDSGTLPKASILTCRLLNKHVKMIVDKELLGSRKPSWLTKAFTLLTSSDIQKFVKKVEGMRRSRGSITPLFVSNLNLLAGTANMNTLELLRNYGPLLQKVRLAITHSDECPLPFPTRIHMFTALNCLPNVVALTLAFEKLNCELHGRYWESDESAGPPFTDFPRLKFLSELTLECLPVPIPIPMLEQFFYPPPASFLEPFLKACGSQLTKLTSHQYFINDIGFDEIFTANIPNIQELTLNLVNFEGDSAVQSLCLMEMPKLQRLLINRDKDGHYVDEKHDGWGDNDEDLLTTASMYKDTLEELQLYKIINAKGLRGLHIDLKKAILPKLKGLTVSADNVDSEMWKLFQTQFPNLEWIRFEPGVKYIYAVLGSDCDSSDSEEEDYSSSEEEEEESHPQPPIPDAAVRKRFYDMFPKLNTIIWVKKQREGTGRAPLQISFSRPSHSSASAEPFIRKGIPEYERGLNLVWSKLIKSNFINALMNLFILGFIISLVCWMFIP